MQEKIAIEGRKRGIIKELILNDKLNIARLSSSLKIPRSSVNHHLSMLEKQGVIKRLREGRAIICKLNPKLVQGFRNELKIEKSKLLISGYTYDPEKQDLKTLQVFQRAISSLKSENIEVERSIAFTTPLARDKIRETKYKKGDEDVALNFEIYQDDLEEIEKKLREAIEKNIHAYEILIDLTPLTKLFSIVALSFAREYSLKAFYHAGSKLVWL